MSEQTVSPVVAVSDVIAVAANSNEKINLLDFNRQQMRAFSPSWVKSRSAPIRS